MNLFHSLEEHAELFLEAIQERMQHQISAFGGAEQRLHDIVKALREHLEPTVETPVATPEVVETPVATPEVVETPVATPDA